MAICILGAEEFYTTAWLKHTAESYGLKTTEDTEEATCFWVTLSDVEDLPTLRKTRRLADGRPVIAGGLEATTGNGIPLAYADGVVVGEGQEFIRVMADRGLDEAMVLPCVARPEAPWQEIVPSTELDIDKAPAVQMTKTCWYVLAARGCPNHCNFCMTSWATRQSKASRARLEYVVDAVTKYNSRHRVTFITNHSQGLPGKKRGAQSFLVRDFLAKPEETRGLTMIRLGIEGLTEARRHWFGKPLSDTDIQYALQLAKQLHLQVEMFFIVGWPGSKREWEHFANNILPIEGREGPHLWAKYTYFGACPFTPMWRYDVTQLQPFDAADAFRLGMARSQRFHDHPIQGLTKALWRTVLHRCRWEHAEIVPKQSPKIAHEEFIEEMYRRGLGYTLAPQEGDKLPGEQVQMWNSKARKTRAKAILEATGERNSRKSSHESSQGFGARAE